MKKLLALVLCVMMFVSVLSMSAFADKPTTAPTPNWTTGGGWNTVAANNKAIKNARENIEYIYGSLAADSAVFGAIQSVDSIVTDLAKGVFDGVDSIDVAIFGLPTREVDHDTLVDNTKGMIRDVVGTEIIKYMNKHMGDYAKTSTTYTDQWGDEMTYVGWGYDSAAAQTFYYYEDGHGHLYALDEYGAFWQFQAAPGTWDLEHAINRQLSDGTAAGYQAAAAVAPVATTTTYKYDPVAYANTFATAATKAMTSEKGSVALQRIMYDLYQLKVYDDVADDFDDLFDEIRAWEDGNNILAAYNFNEALFVPYAFLSENYYPNAFVYDPVIFAP